MNRFVVHTETEKAPIGDLFGIFFEDLNHAADGGIYAEMVQNRSFEFCQVDNKEYHSLTAWEKVGTEENVTLTVEEGEGLFPRAPHYLKISLADPDICGGVENQGFGKGMYFKEGESYCFSCYARGKDGCIIVSLVDEKGQVITKESFSVKENWEKVSCEFSISKEVNHGRLRIMAEGCNTVYLDFISLFPKHTYQMRENGLREDLVTLLKNLHPKFMRFPGGCLVHDGSLNSEDRDSLYRWKNTIGPVTSRPPRRSNWKYNQTLGLGYYEYFLLCEDIGAKPLPVLPAGYDPHHQRKAPLDQMQEWVDDALDLIEFANGDVDTVWGKKRSDLGHPAPFHLEYLGIGNEEVGEGFRERYPYFHKAIREKYPDIQLISSSGPFCAGGEYELGWKSAKQWHADFVDEHYYMSPEWFLANIHRYDEFKKEDPHVFLGEYATWGNTYWNALVEAAYMTGLQNDAPTVGLACYAPLFCNVDYVNWEPDMIWFDNKSAYVTPNYLVQKLFMNHQGQWLLPTTQVEKNQTVSLVDENKRFFGDLILENADNTVVYDQIVVTDDAHCQKFSYDTINLDQEHPRHLLMNMESESYTIHFFAKEIDGTKGFRIFFSHKDEKNYMLLELGGWQNLDGAITEVTNGRGACLTQSEFSAEQGHNYEVFIQVRDSEISVTIDGKPFQSVRVLPVIAEPLYMTASEEKEEIILKVVNVLEESQKAEVKLQGLTDEVHQGTVYELAGFDKEKKNSMAFPNQVFIHEGDFSFRGGILNYEFPAQSVTVLRFKK